MLNFVRLGKEYFEKLRSTITCSSALNLLGGAGKVVWSMPRFLLISIIKGYRLVLSPDYSFWARALDRPPYCKHFPSCSSYALESLQKHGAVYGGWYTLCRILSCNPWSKGGFDPVPPDHEAGKRFCSHASYKTLGAQDALPPRHNSTRISHNYVSHDT